MATEIKLPILGENVDSGVVVNVLVSEGDEVSEGQPLIELETEKATVEVPASASGRIKEIRMKEGDTINVGQVIFMLEEGAGAAKVEEKKPKPPEKPEKKLRETAEAQVEEVKAMAAPSKAPRTETRARPGEEDAKKEAPRAEAAQPRPEARPKPEKAPEPAARDLIAASPSVRRLARELGIDINEVAGSEPGGRVSEEDVRNYARSIILNVTRLRPAAQTVAATLPDFSQWGDIERRPMSGIRR